MTANRFPDIVITPQDGRCGKIAIEIKPPGASREKLVADIKKLQAYRKTVDVSMGLLIYLRATDAHDAAIRRAIRSGAAGGLELGGKGRVRTQV
jgi:hypothetical protein